MNQIQSTVREQSEVSLLLQMLDDQISRYYNILNDIRSVRLSTQSDNEKSDPTQIPVKGLPDQYRPGNLCRLNSLIQRLSELNDNAIIESNMLQQYLL